MTQKRTAAEIAEDLKTGAENRLVDQMFADMCKDLDEKINALRKEFMSLRTRMQFGDESKETFRSHERIAHEIMVLDVEKLFLTHNGDDVIEEVGRRYGAESCAEDKDDILAEFKKGLEEGLGE